MEKTEIKIKKEEKLLKVLTGIGFSYSQAMRLIKNKDILVDSKRVKENILLKSGNTVTVFYDKASLREKNIKIVYEDENVIIADKPVNIEIEGQGGLCEKLNALPVHRLDRNTVGLVILANNKISQQILQQAFKKRKIEKIYRALVYGKTNFDGKIYCVYIKKDEKNARVLITDNKIKGSQEIKNAFKTIENYTNSSLVEIRLITGKTHQIRAHLAYLNHAIVGDGKYGKLQKDKFKYRYQTLACVKITFGSLDKPLEYLSNKSFTTIAPFKPL